MMEQKERRRSTGKVDRLPPELKDTVEQMLLTGCTYKEIVALAEFLLRKLPYEYLQKASAS